MRIEWESPAVKYTALLIVVALAAVFVGWLVHNTFYGKRGLPPDKNTMARMVCTNQQCPGRSHETAPPNSPANVTGAHMYDEIIRAGFEDWPVTCPECGQKSVYHKIYRPGGYLILYRMSTPPLATCPHCGEVNEIESPIAGVLPACRKCGKSLMADVWKVPESR